MSDPINPIQVPIQVPIPEVVQKATKALSATLVTVTGVIGLFTASIADGHLDWSEGGTLIGAVATAATAIYAVWRTPNQVVSVTMR
jgi:hypothetical protein